MRTFSPHDVIILAQEININSYRNCVLTIESSEHNNASVPRSEHLMTAPPPQHLYCKARINIIYYQLTCSPPGHPWHYCGQRGDDARVT